MSDRTTTTYPEPSVQECLAEDGTPTERLLRLTELTLLLTPAREAYGDPIPRRRAQRAADYADAWADDITLVEVTPAAPWVHRSVSYPTIINTIGHVACAVDHLGDGRTSSPQLCYVLRALAANVRTFAGLESPPVSDSDPQRDHSHTPPTSQETVMTTTPQRFTKRPVTIEAAQLTGDTAQWHAIYLWVEANTLGSFEPLDVIEGRKPWPPSGVSIDPRDGRLIISTLEGLHWADEGDWIIRGIQGEFYPCKSDIFDATYEPTAEHQEPPNADDPTDAEVRAAAEEAEYHEQWVYDEDGFPHCECGASLVESEHDLGVVPSLLAHQVRAALLAAREVARHE